MKFRIEVINTYGASLRIYLDKDLDQATACVELERGEEVTLRFTDMESKRDYSADEIQNLYMRTYIPERVAEASRSYGEDL